MTEQEIFDNGTLLDRWPCDVDRNGELDSNGSQEYLFEFEGQKYIVWVDWDECPIRPNDEAISIIEDNEIID